MEVDDTDMGVPFNDSEGELEKLGRPLLRPLQSLPSQPSSP